eukprot:TRINITY_DN94700_c0_g1_i1.p1 TRINITY_DN94700_c0_g1~~TRINITY_DN94700_c0_g1_i1.p1  ORF type:complete len:168 (-),score=45.54 TRINITY_DN94700_c0_g1_i1:429-932(-)
MSSIWRAAALIFLTTTCFIASPAVAKIVIDDVNPQVVAPKKSKTGKGKGKKKEIKVDSRDAMKQSYLMFDKFDADGDGFLSLKEIQIFQSLLDSNKDAMTPSTKHDAEVLHQVQGADMSEMAQQMFKQLDRDSDGKVTREEFDFFAGMVGQVLEQKHGESQKASEEL